MTQHTVLLNEDFDDILDLVAKIEKRGVNELINEAIGDFIKKKIEDPEFQEKLKPALDALNEFMIAVGIAAAIREVDETRAGNSRDGHVSDIKIDPTGLCARCGHPFKEGETVRLATLVRGEYGQARKPIDSDPIRFEHTRRCAPILRILDDRDARRIQLNTERLAKARGHDVILEDLENAQRRLRMTNPGIFGS